MSAELKEQPRTGVFDDISDKEYHTNKSSYSSSLIKKMACPAEAKWYMDNPQPYKDHFAFGRAIHCWILEPEKFEAQFLTGISAKRNSNDTRHEWADWFSSHGWASSRDWIIRDKKPAATWNAEFERVTRKNIVTPDQIDEIKLMAESIKANNNARMLLDGGVAEQSVYATDPDTGLPLKVRPDYMNDYFISDLKSIQDVDDFTIDRAIANFGYDVSGAMYTHVTQLATSEYRPFCFIFISKAPPFMCRVIVLSDESARIGWDKYQELKKKLADCLASNEWPGYDDDLDHTLFAKRS